MSTDTLSPGEPAPTTAWEDMVFSEPELPPDYTPAPSSFDDTPPPQLVRTVNLLPIPEHGLRGPEDIDAIAEQILNRTREGVADIFAHEDYAGYEDEPTPSPSTRRAYPTRCRPISMALKRASPRASPGRAATR